MPKKDGRPLGDFILETLEGAKPYLVIERDLVDILEAEHGYKPNTTRKALRELVRQGLVEKWPDSPYGYALTLSCLAARRRVIEIYQPAWPEFSRATRKTDRTAATAIRADFRGGRWVPATPIKEPPPDAYAKVDGPASAIAAAFREADSARANPYYTGDLRSEFRESDPDHEIRRRGCRSSDDECDEQGRYAIADHRPRSAIVLVGTNTHPEWSPTIEFSGRPADCPVCAGCRPDRGRWICLGCMRSSWNIGETGDIRTAPTSDLPDPSIRAALDQLGAIKAAIARIPAVSRHRDPYLRLAEEKHRLLMTLDRLRKPRRSRNHERRGNRPYCEPSR